MVTSEAVVAVMAVVVADNKLASQLAAARVSRLKLQHRNAVKRHELVLAARLTVADQHWEAKQRPMVTSKDVAAVSDRTHTAPC